MEDKQILEQRATQYGSTQESFGRIANLWSSYLNKRITPVQVANMMVLLKLSRSVTAKDETLKDCYIDGRNYLSLAEELEQL